MGALKKEEVLLQIINQLERMEVKFRIYIASHLI